MFLSTELYLEMYNCSEMVDRASCTSMCANFCARQAYALCQVWSGLTQRFVIAARSAFKSKYQLNWFFVCFSNIFTTQFFVYYAICFVAVNRKVRMWHRFSLKHWDRSAYTIICFFYACAKSVSSRNIIVHICINLYVFSHDCIQFWSFCWHTILAIQKGSSGWNIQKQCITYLCILLFCAGPGFRCQVSEHHIWLQNQFSGAGLTRP